jgi:hypothetical protein
MPKSEEPAPPARASEASDAWLFWILISVAAIVHAIVPTSSVSTGSSTSLVAPTQ